MSKKLLREILSTLDSEYSLPYDLKQKIEAELTKPETCTNSDSWNCKYCNITKTCKALSDNKNFAPPARKPLSVEELIKLRIKKLGEKYPITITEFNVIARAIEKAHGIGDL
jgi:hypothetical protein